MTMTSKVIGTTLLSGNRYYYQDENGDARFEFPLSLMRDLAPMLAWNIRYNGGTKSPWSVAAHAVLVASILGDLGEPWDVQLRGLHHDDAEMITGDMTTPQKRAMRALDPAAMRAFEMIEEQVQTQIEVSLGIFNMIPRHAHAQDAVKRADVVAYVAESRRLRHARTHSDVRDVPADVLDKALVHFDAIFNDGYGHGVLASLCYAQTHNNLIKRTREQLTAGARV